MSALFRRRDIVGVAWVEWLLMGIFINNAVFLNWTVYVSGATIGLLFFLHFYLEGLRWQMTPTYILALNMSLEFADGILFTLLMVVLTGWMLAVFPYPTIPKLPGGFAVAVEDFEFTGEVHNIEHGVRVALFYPTDTRYEHDAKTKFFPDDGTAKGFSRVLNIPSIFIRYLNRVATNCVIIAPLLMTRKKFPLLVFSHGVGCSRMSYSALCQAVAAQGYMVAAVEHNDGSALITRSGPMDTPQFFERNGDRRWHRAQLVTRLAELDIVVDGIRSLCEVRGHWLQSRVNFRAIAVGGHHFGAATAIAACMREHRTIDFKCCLLVSPWLKAFTSSEEEKMVGLSAEGVLPPCLLLNCQDQHKQPQEDFLARLLAKSSQEVRHLDFDGCTTFDHTDMSVIAPGFARYLGKSGPASPIETLMTQAQLCVNFLGKFFPASVHPPFRPSVRYNPLGEWQKGDDYLLKWVSPAAQLRLHEKRTKTE